MRADAFIPSYNAVIEFDGKQHFSEIPFFNKSDLKTTRLRDLIKTQYCAKSGISLLRIHYKDIEDIDYFISKFLNSINELSPYYLLMFSRDPKEWVA